jgi:hypothetical protein
MAPFLLRAAGKELLHFRAARAFGRVLIEGHAVFFALHRFFDRFQHVVVHDGFLLPFFRHYKQRTLPCRKFLRLPRRNFPCQKPPRAQNWFLEKFCMNRETI